MRRRPEKGEEKRGKTERDPVRTEVTLVPRGPFSIIAVNVSSW